MTSATTDRWTAGLAATSRGDGITAIGALLVFVCSFLPQASGRGGLDFNVWHEATIVEVFAVPLLAVAVLAFTLLPLQAPELAATDLLGVRPAAWRTVLSVVLAIAGIFALFAWSAVGGGTNVAYGAYLVFVFGLLTAAGCLVPPYVPALTLPVGTPLRPRPPEPADVGAEPPVASEAPPPTLSFEPTPVPTQAPSSAPAAAADEGVEPVPVAAEPVPVVDPPHPVEPAATAPAPFQPFWACFPTVRPLVDPTDHAVTVGEVTPEEWYLVTGLGEEGASVSTSDGRTGRLLDTSGMIRADQ